MPHMVWPDGGGLDLAPAISDHTPKIHIHRVTMMRSTGMS
jgi:hypothetical protein